MKYEAIKNTGISVVGAGEWKGEDMAKLSIRLVVLGVALAAALAGCVPFGCMVR